LLRFAGTPCDAGRIKMSNRLIKIKGPSKGHCQICGMYGPLTEDHVPPRGASILTNVEIQTMGQALDGGSAGKPAYSQNGVKFRTICSHCNNVKLGATYDSELISLCKEVSTYLRVVIETGLYVGQRRKFNTKPQRVAKAIIGHLLAGCIPEDYEQPPLSAPFPDALRKYFLNEGDTFPENMTVYYWLHPSRRQVIMSYFAYCDIRSKDIIMASVIKFFPMAFLVVWDQPASVKINQNRLLPFNTFPLNEISQIEIDFARIPPSIWPETVGDNNYLLTKDSITVMAKDKPKRRN